MTLVPTDESKYILEKQEELWNKIKDLIRSKTNNSNDYNEKYATIKYNSDDDIILVVVRSAFHEDNNYCPQVFLHECFFSYKCYILMELTFLKVLMLRRQVHQKNVIFVTICVKLSISFQAEMINAVYKPQQHCYVKHSWC